MKKKLTLLLSLILVCATVFPLFASCDAFVEESEWYYYKNGDSKIYICPDEKSGTITVVVEEEGELVSYVFPCEFEDELIKVTDYGENTETYSYKKNSGSYIVINGIKFKLAEEPEDYGIGNNVLTLYEIFGYSAGSSVMTDTIDETTWENEETGPVSSDTAKDSESYDSIFETENTTKGPNIDNVPKNDWGGHIFRVYYSTVNNAQTDFIGDNTLSGSIVDAQVYKRNTEVENRLNIKIMTIPHTTDYSTVIKAQYAAGYTEGDYEMVTGSDQNAVNLAVTGCLADLAQYGEIDLNGPYWEQVYIEKNTFAGSLYSLLGDYSLTANLSVSSICFNKKLMIEQGHKEPYDLVRTYEWTVEKMLSYMEGFARDNDGDGTFDYDMDCFSLSGNGPESVYGIFYGSGFTFCTNDGEQCEFDYNMTLLGEILDRTVDVWCQRGVYLNNSSQEIMKQLTLEIFSSGRGLFCDVPLYKIGESFGEMEDDYGILPEPMFTKEQGTYYSYVYRNVPIMLVPANDPNPERTGNIIETVCAASSDIVIDNVFDIVTKTRNVRDPDSAEMIDIIIENKVFDVAHWLDLAGYGTLSAMVVKEKNPDIFVSYINMYKNKAENDLNNYIEAYKKLQKN